jgi:pimeloyl-ACP methyl ester carboxylesterase
MTSSIVSTQLPKHEMAAETPAAPVKRVPYAEFSYLSQNAAEYGLAFDKNSPPTVSRVHVDLADGRKLSALKWGPGEPEIVLLHGGAQNAHTWDTVCLALGSNHGVSNLLCIDLPGHGHSDGPGDGQRGGAGPRGAAKDVAEVIRMVAPNAKGVVGMSFGGLTLVSLAGEHAPELVRRVFLVDVLPGLQGGRGNHIVEFVNGPPSFPSFEDILARTQAFNPTRSVSSLRRGILHNAEQQQDGSWVWRHSKWRVTDSAKSEVPKEGGEPRITPDLVEALGKIKVPVLLARGMRKDSVLRDDDEERLKDVLPSAAIKRFDEAGHSIQGDMPVELAAAIAEFMDSQ